MSSDAAVDAALPDARDCVAVNGMVTLVNGPVRIEYGLGTGNATFLYDGVKKISNFYAGVQLASYTTTRMYTSRTCLNDAILAIGSSHGDDATDVFMLVAISVIDDGRVGGGNLVIQHPLIDIAVPRAQIVNRIPDVVAAFQDVGEHRGTPRRRGAGSEQRQRVVIGGVRNGLVQVAVQ